MKICPKCGVDKPLSEYYKRNDKPIAYCKPCWNAYSVAHQRKKADEYRDRRQKYERDNRERLLEIRKAWRHANPDKAKAIWDRSHAKRRSERDYVLAHIPPATHKWCRRCNEIKTFTEFNKNKHKSDGVDTYCRPCAAAKQRAFFASNKDRTRSYQRKYWEENRQKVNAYNKEAKLRRRKTSVVAWADKQAIAKIYAEAAMLTAQTGVRHEVDHIIPLKHPLVCGLHVPENLRVVTRSENARKSNKYEPA